MSASDLPLRRRVVLPVESMTNHRLNTFIASLGILLTGCYTPQTTHLSEAGIAQTDSRVDFADPVLNQRQILLFGSINQKAAERIIQRFLFLEAKSHDPIDLYLQTPGGEFKHFMAIEQILSRLQSPVNTFALSECNSGGALLLAAGTGKRRAFHGAVVILHGLKITGRPPPGLKEKIQDAYTDFWRRRTRLPKSWLPMPLDILHVLSAEQALEFGIVDEIIDRRE